MIPKIIHRVALGTVPEEYENYWSKWKELHPGWKFMDWRDPLDPSEFETGHLWDGTTYAQQADYIRLEVLLRHGGVYLDWDIEPVQSLMPLIVTRAFACWEDRMSIPNSVLGAEPGHPAIRECLDRVIAYGKHTDTRMTGPKVTTKVLREAPDVLLLSPDYFFPYHFTELERSTEDFSLVPWTIGIHRWGGSWKKQVTPCQKIFRIFVRIYRAIKADRAFRKLNAN